MTEQDRICPRCFISQPLDAPANPLCGMCVSDLKRGFANYNQGREGR